jgi:hypothetical protein
LPSFLGACKAVALLSPLGYGVKTTIIDALASGAQVLAHPSLVRRSPSLVRPFLLTLDNKCSRDLDAVEEALTAAPRGEAVQRELRERADATMGRCFGTSAG